MAMHSPGLGAVPVPNNTTPAAITALYLELHFSWSSVGLAEMAPVGACFGVWWDCTGTYHVSGESTGTCTPAGGLEQGSRFDVR